jgi:hypothetical protein
MADDKKKKGADAPKGQAKPAPRAKLRRAAPTPKEEARGAVVRPRGRVARRRRSPPRLRDKYRAEVIPALSSSSTTPTRCRCRG